MHSLNRIALLVGTVTFLFIITVDAQQPQNTTAGDLSSSSVSAGASSTAHAARLVKFSGTMRDRAGAPLSGMIGVSIALYKEQQGGTPLWMETQNVSLDAQGNFSVLLGSTQSEGLPLELFATAESRWLGVQAQLPGEMEQPRMLLVGVPYALKAADAETLGGKPLSAFVLAAPDSTGTQAASTLDSGQRIVSQIASAVSGGTASVTGGTPGQIAKFDVDGVSLVNSVIEEKNGNIGLGTANPGSIMELFNVAPNLRLRGTFVQNGNFGTTFAPPLQTDVLAALGQYTGSGGGVLYGFSGSDASIPGVTLDGYMGTSTPTAPAVLITGTKPSGVNNNVALGSTEKLLQVVNNLGPGLLTVLGGGNVGIGTATPSQLLEVAGTAKVATLMFGDGSTITTAPGGGGAVFPFVSISGAAAYRDGAALKTAGADPPTERMHASGGDAYLPTAGNGIILKSPDGSKCARISLDDTGALVTTALACP